MYNVPTTETAVVGENFAEYLDFSYSGTATPQASVEGSVLPAGMQLSPVYYSPDGFDVVEYFGIPTSIQNYPLTLELTDNGGASFSQHFEFDVIKNPINATIMTNSIPDATVGMPYNGTIDVNWVGEPPQILVSGLPLGLSSSPIRVLSSSTSTSSGNGTIQISGTPIWVGQFALNVQGQDITLNVDPNAANPENPFDMKNLTIGNNYYSGAGDVISFEYGGQEFNIPNVAPNVDINQVANTWLAENVIGYIPGSSTISTISNPPNSVESAAVSPAVPTTTSNISPAPVPVPTVAIMPKPISAHTTSTGMSLHLLQDSMNVSSVPATTTITTNLQRTANAPSKGFFSGIWNFLRRLF